MESAKIEFQNILFLSEKKKKKFKHQFFFQVNNFFFLHNNVLYFDGLFNTRSFEKTNENNLLYIFKKKTRTKQEIK